MKRMDICALMIAIGLVATGCAEAQQTRGAANAYVNERWDWRRDVRGWCKDIIRDTVRDMQAAADRTETLDGKMKIRAAQIALLNRVYPSVPGSIAEAVQQEQVGDVTCFGTVRSDPIFPDQVQDADAAPLTE